MHCIYTLRFRLPYVIFVCFQGFHATPLLSMTLSMPVTLFPIHLLCIEPK